MTTSNKPENQKNHDSLSDLGQITFEPKRHENGGLYCHLRIEDAPRRRLAVSYDSTDKAYALDTYATLIGDFFDLAIALEMITSTSKDRREHAKKNIKQYTGIGQAILDEAFRRMREFEAQETDPRACVHCGAIHDNNLETRDGYACWLCVNPDLILDKPEDD